MKINQPTKKHSIFSVLPSKTSLHKVNLKTKQHNRKKSKKVNKTPINQLISWSGDTKISYHNSPCGTIECLEKIRHTDTGDNQPHCAQVIESCQSLTNDLDDEIRKRQKCKVLKQKSGQNHQSGSTNSIVKMTADANIYNSNTLLKHFSDVRKSDSSGLFIFESLMLTDSKEKAKTITGAKISNVIENTEFSVLRKSKSSKQSQTISEIKSVSPSSKTKHMTVKTNQDCSNNPVCSIVSNINNTNSVRPINFYELDCSKYLVLMKPESSLAVIGAVELQLLKGSLEILGYNLHKEDEKLLIFSLQGSSHLCLKAKTVNRPTPPLKGQSDKSTFEKLIALGLPEELSHKVCKKAGSGVLFTVNRNKTHVSSTVWPRFFEHHSSFNIYPNTDLFNNDSRPCHIVERKIQCLFETNLQDLGLKEFNEVSVWFEIEKDILNKDYPKAIICGGKSVGKSSFLRYLVNKCLFRWKQIVVLDFDLGQCEFTVPGCISLTIVDEPLLGPNYSHLKKSKRSVFLGEVDVTKCPESYIEGCKTLIDYARHKHSDIPWIINTMGFNRGFGVSLTCGIINYVSPTHVVQIQSKDRKLNFPSVLEPKFVNCLKHSAFDKPNNTMDYQLYAIPSGSEQSGFISKSRGASPAECRSLVILSYLSRMLDANITNLSQVIPYMISMEQVDLQTTNQHNLTKAQVAGSMNGNMVALCHNIPSDPFLNCCGFGIVRAVDWQNGTIFLITPLPPDELSRVNCLVKGNVGLPDSLYYNQGDQVAGHVPYLALTSGGSTARFAKRDFRTLPVAQKANKQYR